MGKFRIIDELEPAGDFKIAQSSDIAYNDKSVAETLDDLALVAEQVAANTPAIEQNTLDISEQSGKIETLTEKVTAAETAIAEKASQEEVETIKTDVAGKASTEDVSQLQTEMDVQKARMDQLVGTVPEGSADEIADARVTVDGKTEANLGNAIRSQVTSLKETIADYGEILGDKVARDIVWEPGSLYSTDGSENDTMKSTRIRSNFVAVKDAIGNVTMSDDSIMALAYIYDDNKTFIRVTGSLKNTNFSANGAYVRLVLYRGNNPIDVSYAKYCTLSFPNIDDINDKIKKIESEINSVEKLKYVAFGDSLTIGRRSDDWVLQTDRAYPAVFGKYYNYDVVNLGVGGQGLTYNDTSATVDLAYNYVVAHHDDIADADLITFKWGNNDRSNGDLEGCISAYKQIFDYVKSVNPYARIVVLSPNNVTSTGTSTEKYWYNGSGKFTLNQFNNAVSALCNEYDIPYVDVNYWSSVDSLAECLGDNVHPKDAAFEKYHRYVVFAIASAIKKNNNEDKIAFDDINFNKENIDKIARYVNYDKVIVKWSQGSLYDATGLENDASTTRVRSDFIATNRPINVEIDEGYRIIVFEYNSDKEFVRQSEIYYIADRDIKFEDAAYIRIVVFKRDGANIDLSVLDHFKFIYADTTTIENAVLKIGAMRENSYISKADGSLKTDSTRFSSSDFISVLPNTTIHLENVFANMNTSICEYDINKNYISTLAQETTATIIDITTSSEARYIRITAEKVNVPEGYYKDFYTHGISNIAELLNSQANSSSANRQAVFTVIDDDTSYVAAVQRYYNLCKSLNVRGNYAVITSHLDEDENLISRLHDYENEGFGMLFHCQSQDSYWNWANFNLASCEENYCIGNRKYKNSDFTSGHNYFISPFGNAKQEVQDMAKRHGAECLISTNNNVIVKHDEAKRYNIPRCSLGHNAERYPDFSIEQLKSKIDEAAEKKEWIIITTHVNEWDNSTSGEERFTEVVNYAKEKGLVCKTFAEAYEERKSDFYAHE